jgi:hypothetical protein
MTSRKRLYSKKDSHVWRYNPEFRGEMSALNVHTSGVVRLRRLAAAAAAWRWPFCNAGYTAEERAKHPLKKLSAAKWAHCRGCSRRLARRSGPSWHIGVVLSGARCVRCGGR